MTKPDPVLRAAQIINQGGIVCFPTETVYGLGANAFNESAVAAIFEIKKRPRFDPLIVHIDHTGYLEILACKIPPKATELTRAFWPGPLTVVFHKQPTVPDIVTAGLPSIAVRIPSNEIALKLIKTAAVPIAAPSANLFGTVSPTTASHVRDQLGPAVDMILDGGRCKIGIESTVISFTSEQPVLLRPGGIALEDIERTIGKIIIPEKNQHINLSPGRCNKHYSPRTELVLCNSTDEIPRNKKAALLSLAPVEERQLPSNICAKEILSDSGDLREAACNLFAAMRKLDNYNPDAIYALPVPGHGLGLAINDRLSRAAAANYLE